MDSLGKTIVVIGLIVVAAGLVVWGGSSIPVVSRLGRLPGDIYIQRGNFTLYFPITTAIVVSVVLSLIFAAVKR